LNENREIQIFPRGDPRIVLFVDDLDRCPPDKVVEMLEALQLLVKTRLFVVVVALDMRYVTLALEKEYKGILEAGRHPSGLDYLEKIIQLPYQLPPVDKQEAMGKYITAQMGKLKEDVDSEKNDGKNDDDGKPDVKIDENKNSNESSNEGPDVKAQEDVDNEKNVDGKTDESGKQKGKEKNGNAVMVPILFTRDENKMLKDACSLADVSPRSIKRLVTVFKIMKIIWHHEKREPEPDLKRACVYLLAMCASKSNILLRGMRAIFDEMETSTKWPTTHSNLKEFVYKKFIGATVPNRASVDNVLEKVSWKDNQGTWKNVKAQLRMVRCFSFIGPCTEKDRDYFEAEQKNELAELEKTPGSTTTSTQTSDSSEEDDVDNTISQYV